MTRIQAMPRSMRRAAQKHLQQENANWPARLREWPRLEWPEERPGVLRVLRSRDFLVQEFAASDPAIVRLSINRTTVGLDGEWMDKITWDDLQRLKREAGYGAHEAVEVFPPDVDVVNVAKMRHLWILPAGTLPFVWRSGK